MVFSSYLFLFYFLPLALLLYYAVPRRAQHLILTVDWTNYGVDFGILDTMDDKKCNQLVAIVGSGPRVLPGSGSRPRAEH